MALHHKLRENLKYVEISELIRELDFNIEVSRAQINANPHDKELIQIEKALIRSYQILKTRFSKLCA